MRPLSPLPSLAVGTMNFGSRTDSAQSRRIVERALERGLTLFDTANLYSNGESERILGQALRARRADVLLATKVGLQTRGREVEGLGRARIVEACEESLGRLQTDVIDLYYLHAPDSRTPLAETMDGVASLLESGKIRAWGVSNHASWQIMELQQRSDERGMPRPLASQVIYNLLVRQLDIEYFAFAQRHPIHTTVYNPLAAGLLARDELPVDARVAKNPLYRRRYGSSSMGERARAYRDLARSVGMTPATLAYAFAAHRPGVDSVLLGPATTEQLDAGIDGCTARLPEEVLARVDSIHLDFVGTDARYAR